MGKERKLPTGHLTVRCSPEIHGELMEIADAQGIDLSPLCFMMINEVRPKYLDEARKLMQRIRRSREAFDQALTGADHPKVAHLVRHGRGLPAAERLKELAKAVHLVWKQGDPPPATLVEAAEKLLREEELRLQIRRAVEETGPPGRGHERRKHGDGGKEGAQDDGDEA